MRSLRRNIKALSPVVAAIILIAVTVAVSIAVAAWMGALTFTFMGTEELEVQNGSFESDPKAIVLTVKNKGTSKLTITSANVGTTVVDVPDVALDAGADGTVTISHNWSSGVKYYVELVTATGKKFPWTGTAP